MGINRLCVSDSYEKRKVACNADFEVFVTLSMDRRDFPTLKVTELGYIETSTSDYVLT